MNRTGRRRHSWTCLVCNVVHDWDTRGDVSDAELDQIAVARDAAMRAHVEATGHDLMRQHFSSGWVSDGPTRYCMGDPVTLTACGRVAVVVCSMIEEPGGPPVQWFACELGEHQALDLGADAEPIATWFARLERHETKCPGAADNSPGRG